MGLLRACTVMEQNANTWAGVQVDTALMGSGVGVTLRAGREAPVYIVAGTQTSSLSAVVLDTGNAKAGDQFIVKKYTTAVIGTGASQVVVVNGSAAGTVIGAFQVGTASPNLVVAVFDGVAGVWR